MNATLIPADPAAAFIPETENFDPEEVLEFTCPDSHTPDGSDGYPSLSPLDHRFSRSHPYRQDAPGGAARVAAANTAPRCVHIKPSGMRCKAPAMRGMDYCYFHKRTHIGPRLLYPTLMMLEDAHGIQAAIMEVLCAILEGTLDRKLSGQLLYGLQTAASNLKRMHDIDPADVTTEEPATHDRMPDGVFKPEPASGWVMDHPEEANRQEVRCTPNSQSPANAKADPSAETRPRDAVPHPEAAERPKGGVPRSLRKEHDPALADLGGSGDMAGHRPPGTGHAFPLVHSTPSTEPSYTARP